MAIQGQSFSVLASTTESNYLATGLTTGQTYEFMIEARNEYGYSEFSDVLTLISAYIPAVPTSVTTVMDGS